MFIVYYIVGQGLEQDAGCSRSYCHAGVKIVADESSTFLGDKVIHSLLYYDDA